MIKRTLYFGNPAYLKTINEQLVVETSPLPVRQAGSVPLPNGEARKEAESKSIPIEDIGMLILDHQQITITQALLSKLVVHHNTRLASQ